MRGRKGRMIGGRAECFNATIPVQDFCKGVKKKILSCKLVHKFYSAVIAYIFRKHLS